MWRYPPAVVCLSRNASWKAGLQGAWSVILPGFELSLLVGSSGGLISQDVLQRGFVLHLADEM
jgi:hypothetical protein